MLHKQHLLLMLAVAATASAQTFDAASVKSTGSTTGRFIMEGGPGTNDPGRISYRNIPLRRILLDAYDVRNYQLSGPDWLDSLRYDITAKIPAGTSREEFRQMLRGLLETRFRMQLRREAKEMPVYELVVARNGPKVKPISGVPASMDGQIAVVRTPEGPDGFPALSLPGAGVVIETRAGKARVTVRESPLAKLADLLTRQLDRPVLDKTGLPGNYSFELYFTPERQIADGGVDIFGALPEQLGLRLESRRDPVELLIVDRAEKVPVEN